MAEDQYQEDTDGGEPDSAKDTSSFGCYNTPMSMADEILTLQFDGGSRGNPGPAGVGVVVRAGDGTPLVTLGKFVGRATNNVAEYTGVIVALEEALKLGGKKIAIKGDSELIIKQLKGEYRVKHPDMKVLYDRAMALIRKFEQVTIGHNLRDKNELADKLANLAMDRKGDVTDADDTGPTRTSATEPKQPNAIPGRFGCQTCGCVLKVEKTPLLPGQPLKAPVCLCGNVMKPVKGN